MITVDGMPALCLDLDCDFTYTESESLVQSQSLSEESLLTIGGIMLPNATSDVVYLGPVTCSRVVLDEFVSSTSQECTVEEHTNSTDNTTYSTETCVDIYNEPEITEI